MTLKILRQKYGKCQQMKVLSLDRVEKIVLNEEIACFDQFLHLPVFSKVVCCRCVEMRLQVGKG